MSAACEPPDPEVARQRAVLDRFARAVVERRMATPAMLFFESVQPLSFVAGQALAFLHPMVSVLLDAPDYEVFLEAIEDRENLRWLVDRLEALEEERLNDRQTQHER